MASDMSQTVSIQIAGICNIWVGGSGAGSIQGDAATSGFLHFDTSDGGFGLLLEEEYGEKPEDHLLDCLAILIVVCRHRARLRNEKPPNDVSKGAPRQELLEAWQSTDDASPSLGLHALRPPGVSLTANHLQGHAAALLTAIGEAVVPDQQLV